MSIYQRLLTACCGAPSQKEESGLQSCANLHGEGKRNAYTQTSTWMVFLFWEKSLQLICLTGFGGNTFVSLLEDAIAKDE